MGRVTKVILTLVSVDASMFIMQMILMPFKASELNLTNVQMGYIGTTFAFFQLIGNPVFGRICDKVSIRTSFMITFTSWASLQFLTATAGSFGGVLLSRVPAMFALGMQAAQAAIPKVTSGSERDTAMSQIMMSFGVGVIGGPLLGGVVSSLLGNNWAYLFAAVLCGGMLIVVFMELPGDSPSPAAAEREKSEETGKGISGTLEDYAKLLKKPTVGTLMLIKALCTAPFVVQDPILSLYLVQVLKVTPGQNASLGVAMGILMIVAAGFVTPQVQKHFSVRSAFQIASGLVLLTYCGMCFFNSFYQLFIINPWYMAANAIVGAISDATLGGLVSESESGTCFGLSNSMLSLTGIVGPVFAGYMNKFIGFNFIIYFGVSIAASIYALTWRIPEDLKKPKEE